MSIRDELLNINDAKAKSVFIDEWDREVFIRRIPNIEMERLVKTLKGMDDGISSIVWWAIYGLSDQGGKPVFTPKDFDAVAGKNNFALKQIADAVIAYNRANESLDDTKKVSASTTPPASG